MVPTNSYPWAAVGSTYPFVSWAWDGGRLGTVADGLEWTLRVAIRVRRCHASRVCTGDGSSPRQVFVCNQASDVPCFDAVGSNANELDRHVVAEVRAFTI